MYYLYLHQNVNFSPYTRVKAYLHVWSTNTVLAKLAGPPVYVKDTSKVWNQQVEKL